MSVHDVNTCPFCQIGHLRAGQATYIHRHEGQIIIAPDTPAQICDVCGRQEFDPAALRRIYALTGEAPLGLRPTDEPRPNIAASPPTPPTDRKKPPDPPKD